MIAAIVLAAGRSTRFGSQKLLAPLGKFPLVRRTVEQVLSAPVDDVVVVVGQEGEAVQRALSGLDVRCVMNADHAKGMSTSVRAGVDALRAGTSAVVIVLGDQPTVTPEIIEQLVAEHSRGARPITAPSYAGIRGNPVVFDASLFPELRAIEGDEGARSVITRDPARVTMVSFPVPMPPDIDTPDDYRSLLDGDV